MHCFSISYPEIWLHLTHICIFIINRGILLDFLIHNWTASSSSLHILLTSCCIRRFWLIILLIINLMTCIRILLWLWCRLKSTLSLLCRIIHTININNCKIINLLWWLWWRLLCTLVTRFTRLWVLLVVDRAVLVMRICVIFYIWLSIFWILLICLRLWLILGLLWSWLLLSILPLIFHQFIIYKINK